MCIAILNRKGKITKKRLRICFDNNPDGAGLLWAEDRQLQSFKTFKFPEFWKTYSTLRDKLGEKGFIVLHFRIATSGKVNDENCHPFITNRNIGFVHNGILSVTDGDKVYSDTYYFNEFLKNFKPKWRGDVASMTILQNMIGSSKMIFMDNLGTAWILNADAGAEEDGNWYSNETYKSSSKFYASCGWDLDDDGAYGNSYSRGRTGHYDDYDEFNDTVNKDIGYGAKITGKAEEDLCPYCDADLIGINGGEQFCDTCQVVLTADELAYARARAEDSKLVDPEDTYDAESGFEDTENAFEDTDGALPDAEKEAIEDRIATNLEFIKGDTGLATTTLPFDKEEGR